MAKKSIKSIINSLPTDPGVYMFEDTKGMPLYIGKAARIKERVRTHFYEPGASSPQQKALLRDTASILPYTTSSEVEALVLESRLIKSLRPRYNVMLRDDKQYFYVGFTNEIFPKLFLTHQLKTKNLKLKTTFVGPFTDGNALKQTIKRLRYVFPYCTCKKPHKQFCLNYHMGKDLGYCCVTNAKGKTHFAAKGGSAAQAGYEKLQIKSKNVGEYKHSINAIKKILQGRSQNVVRELKKAMDAAAKEQKFEKAATLRNQWEGLQNIFAHRHVIRAEKQRHAVSDIQYSLFNIREMHRIEGYDVSNIQGNFAVGSMVVFSRKGKWQFSPQKNAYRKFRIKTVRGANDPAMMREILCRRLAHKEWPLPDLIVVDGGKTQRNAALKAMASARVSLPLVGLAKKEEELYTEKGRVLLSSLPLPSELLFRHLRDEAHRFAIQYYRKVHRKSIVSKIKRIKQNPQIPNHKHQITNKFKAPSPKY